VNGWTPFRRRKEGIGIARKHGRGLGEEETEKTVTVNRDDIVRYSVTVRLKDRRPATIRAVRPSDKGLIIEALRGLSADSVYYRLFASKKEFTKVDLKEITEVHFLNVGPFSFPYDPGVGLERARRLYHLIYGRTIGRDRKSHSWRARMTRLDSLALCSSLRPALFFLSVLGLPSLYVKGLRLVERAQ
jgi:1,2-phenylacetyl-CoA epoxidase PaaB subunit